MKINEINHHIPRPCVVITTGKIYHFHGFAGLSEHATAILEDESGHVSIEYAKYIRFIDRDATYNPFGDQSNG